MTLLDSYIDDASALEAAGEDGIADAILDMAVAIEAAGVTSEDEIIDALTASGFLLTAEEAFGPLGIHPDYLDDGA